MSLAKTANGRVDLAARVRVLYETAQFFQKE
jgi:hypothetical protein